MKQKIIGKYICMLLIVAVVIPAIGVKNMEPNEIFYPCVIPNDTNFSNQWYLHNTGQTFYENLSGTPDADIDIPEAWDIEKGSSDVVIAILSSGIDYNHPDLASKIWNNTDEIPGNSLDDDHNGYIDDIRGWDFVYNNSNVTDGFGHGTMNAGVIGAVTNNDIGIAGVGWNCTIMPIKVSNEYGQGTLTTITNGIKYAADNGADICSMNFVMTATSQLLEEAVNYAYGKGVFLCGSAGIYNNSAPRYPAAYKNVTAVAATNQDDKRCTEKELGLGNGSDYGDWVDIAAPSNLIFSTMPTYYVNLNDQGFQQNYDYSKGGFIYATPIVAGVAALLLSKDSSLTPDQVKALLCGNVDPYDSAEYIGTGRLNAQKALLGLELFKETKIKGGLGVKMVITNSGTTDIKNVAWQIQVEGGILGVINKTKNGTIDVPAGKSMSVSTGILFGLGSFRISAQVAGVEKIKKGTQIFILSMVKE